MYFLQNKSDASREVTSDSTPGSKRQCPSRNCHPSFHGALGWHREPPGLSTKPQLTELQTTTKLSTVLADHWGQVTDGHSH